MPRKKSEDACGDDTHGCLVQSILFQDNNNGGIERRRWRSLLGVPAWKAVADFVTESVYGKSKMCFLNNHNATTAARISWRSVNSKSNHHPPGPNVQNRGYRLGQETHKIYISRFRVIMDSATQVSGTLVPGLFIVATDNIWHFLATHSSLVGSGDGAKGGIWHEPMLLVPSCEPTCNLPTPSWRNVPIKRVLIVKPMWMLPWKQPTTKWQGNNVVSEGKSFL